MNATLYRKNRKHWSEPPAVVSPAQGIDTIFRCIAPPEVVPNKTKPTKANISPALKNEEMKGGCA